MKEGGEVGLDVATACCLQMCDGQHGMSPAVVGLSFVKNFDGVPIGRRPVELGLTAVNQKCGFFTRF